LQVQVGAVEDQVKALNQEVRSIRQSIQRFDGFLNGLRRLLSATLEEEAEATPAVETSESATPDPEITVIPLATPTP
jgi:hypothetical protein